jgi:hypothetical protein
MKGALLHAVCKYDKGMAVMAVLFEDIYPAAITIELLDAVTDEIGVDTKISPGGFLHLHFEKDGRAHGVDVWDSIEVYQLFVESTLMPALGKTCCRKRHRPLPIGRARGDGD